MISDYVALQPQHSLALLDLYPEEAIYHTARFRGLSSPEARRQTEELMAELGLAPAVRRVVWEKLLRLTQEAPRSSS